ncbi:MAG TPA: hypothetical protein VLY03_01610 [Bacteroidota bacterium]|nr:hypothetical protein [Bacteroidota bacterium]
MRFILWLMVLIPARLVGGFEFTPMGARPAAMGGAYTASGEDAWVLFSNPAGLAHNTSFNISLFSSPAPYGLPELSTSGLAVAFHPGAGTIGAGVRRYGFSLYHELSGGISYARSIDPVALGFTLTCYNVSIQNYGSASTLGIDAGLLVSLSEHVRWGMAFLNVNAATIGASHEPLPRRFSAGFSYQPAGRSSFFCDMVKDSGFDADLRAGFEYWIVDAFAIRAGMKNEPSEISGGVGVRWGSLEVDYTYVSHADLGGSHLASITFR